MIEKCLSIESLHNIKHVKYKFINWKFKHIADKVLFKFDVLFLFNAKYIDAYCVGSTSFKCVQLHYF